MTSIIAASGSGFNTPSTFSLDCVFSEIEWLEMTDANFGAYNLDKFAISIWADYDAVSGTEGLMSHGDDPTQSWSFNGDQASNGVAEFEWTTDGTTQQTATVAGDNHTGSFNHLYTTVDTAGAGVTLYRDAVAGTPVATSTLFDSSGVVNIARDQRTAGRVDGLLYQVAFFNGSFPSAAFLYNGGTPRDVRGIGGLHSLVEARTGNVLIDGKLTANWSQGGTGTVTSSTTVP